MNAPARAARPVSLDAGWALVPRFVEREVAEALADAVARQVSRVPTDGGHGILRHDCRASVPELESLAGDGRLAELACALTGASELTLFQDVLVWKTPGATEPLPWHRDFDYWPLDRASGAVLWLALDDADADNGCVYVVEGSQREPCGDAAPDALAARAIPVPARRGDLLVMHPLLWHASPANASQRHRRAWITTWIDPDARWAPERAHHPFNYLFTPEPGTRVLGERFPRFAAPETSDAVRRGTLRSPARRA